MAGGKTYQVTQVDPLNPHTKGMVYQVNIVGGGTQMEELPEATADNVGMVFQYLGESDANFTHGYFYENKAQGTDPETYAWEAIDTQAGGAVSTANTDLSNLTATGKNIANWSSNVSNCITNIPQDINLTLSNGTLTLKAGSKITAPDGTQATTTEDKTYTYPSSYTGQALLFVAKTTGAIQDAKQMSQISSGSSLPESPSPLDAFYNSSDSKIYLYSGGSWIVWDVAFPVALLTITSGTISSIDQVFNGAGYIGHHAFVLPNVSALCPTGRNSDGTLKSQARTTDSVVVVEMGTGQYQGYNRRISIIAGNPANSTGCYIEVADRSELQQKDWVRQYIVSENIIVAWTGSQYVEFLTGIYPPQTPFVEYLYDGTNIKLFSVRNVFRALDENNTEFIAHQAAPSSRYVNLAWPSSGNTIKAPADGYFTLLRLSGATGEFAYFSNASSGLTIGVNAGGAGLNQRLTCRVSKGDIITIGYNLSGSATYLRFVYANGSK